MKGMSGQYANELVSLTILALMIIALIAGQTGVSAASTAQADAVADAPVLAARINVVIDATSARVD